MTGPLPLALTMGDPAGIGIEIAAVSWLSKEAKKIPPFFLVGSFKLIEQYLTALPFDTPIRQIHSANETKSVFPNHLPVLDPEVNGDATVQTISAIQAGVRLCQNDEAAALVTNPIQKKRLYDAGFNHPGHTEFLADLTGVPGNAVMMFACSALKVVPATIHIPLSEVSSTLTASHLEHVIRTTCQDLQSRFGKASPRIVIAGLNPHAGEEGSIGLEELNIISPLVRKLAREGMKIKGPFPADSLFHPKARAEYDAAICMYHDQALIPIKTIDFDNGVNVTLGLPIIRTSPDHGTAEDIVGQGIANPASLIASIRMAHKMADYVAKDPT